MNCGCMSLALYSKRGLTQKVIQLFRISEFIWVAWRLIFGLRAANLMHELKEGKAWERRTIVKRILGAFHAGILRKLNLVF